MVDIDMNETQDKVNFCPKCGSVLNGSVCPGCGYQMAQLAIIPQDNQQNTKSEWERQMFHQNIQQSPVYAKKQPKQKKKHGWGIVAFGVGLLCLCGLTVVGGLFIGKFIIRNIQVELDEYETGSADNVVPEEPYITQLPTPDDGMERTPENPDDSVEDYDGEEEWNSLLTVQGEEDNPFLKDSYYSHMGTDHTNYSRDEFEDHYDIICDSIDAQVSYSIERKYYSYIAEANNVQIQISCVELAGDLPNIDTVNRTIREKTLFLANVFLEYYSDYVSEKGINILIDSYVTYNDDSTISIVLDEYYQLEDSIKFDLYCINFDLETGMLLNNGNILSMDEAFVREFKEKSTKQNGSNEILNQMDDWEVLSNLQNEYSNIIFYTPIGMELGINYDVNGFTGWLTVTYKDYRKYINHV